MGRRRTPIIQRASSPEQIARFRASIAGDLYAATDIVDIKNAERVLDESSAEISAIQTVVAHGVELTELTELLLESPKAYGLLCSILSVSGEIELEDGRKLTEPSKPPRDRKSAESTATLLLDLGIRRILNPETEFRNLLLVVQIARDAANRRFRVDSRMERRIKNAVTAAVEQVNAANNWVVATTETSDIPLSARRLVDHVVSVDGTPRIAIASTFQAYSGGRQTREMTTLYPELQKTLAKAGVDLILVADGRGMKLMSDRALQILFNAVPETMSLREAEDGRLAAAIEAYSVPKPAPTIDDAGLRQIIISTLSHRPTISAAALPTDESQAQRALANYASERDDLALALDAEATSLSWTRAGVLQKLRAVSLNYDGESTLSAVGALFGASVAKLSPTGAISLALSDMPDSSLFKTPFAMGSSRGGLTISEVRTFAKAALAIAPESRIALLVVSQPISENNVIELRRAQPLLPVNVIVLDLKTALETAQSRSEPRDRLVSLSLEQSDLTKISPFVVRSVTPKQAFFGREEEENTLISTLPTNSVALLGGRRIGKTSLMRHCFDRLEAAGLKPFFADCQVVKTWTNFGALAQREWRVDVSTDFRPDHMFDVVSQLRRSPEDRVVIMLDEIDQLLVWDKSHEEDEVPEAFFRACRAISQQNLAQFVFSGERSISTTMWDAASPHWNFCRPMLLRQLTRTAADQLISFSLRSLGVRIDDQKKVLDACWHATDGHPELLQLVGDRLVALINKRARSGLSVSVEDVIEVTATYEYAEQYLETYWGQSTLQERILSLMIVEEPKSVDQIMLSLKEKAVEFDIPDLQTSLRMLELYGIISKWEKGYKLNARWFSRALEYYGGIETTAMRYKEMLVAA